ncbi:Phage portal protein [Crateriforma conspicua]|uniref:Phage portal protein n=1 Tax=Crateriforma conspicua TaxID=2527996 RepID=A0A5C6G089_9PLAN|nr:phage portal protein [Crateriforma conspicua]TWU67295.1 Phage portal protein [Crateriforma conspicua]
MNQSPTEPMAAGVFDALSVFHVGGPMMSAAGENDGDISSLRADKIKDWLRDALIPDRNQSGVHMSPRRAMSYAPVHYALSKVSGHIGMMSLSLKQRIGQRKTRVATRHPAFGLILEPNHLYSGSVFTETVTGHAVFRGNGRAYIERDAYMRPLGLVIIPPDRCRTVVVDGEKWHIASLVVNTETGETRDYRLNDRDVLHVMGFSIDGITGVDVYGMAKESIALGLAAESQQSYHLGRKARPGLILQDVNSHFKDDDEARGFLRQFRDMHDGLDNAGKTALLRHGIKAVEAPGHSGRDSQVVETRQFQREDAALFWCLESILGEDGNSYASEEQRTLAYLKGLPGKLKKRWEEERDRKLLTESQKRSGQYFHELNAGSLLRADMKTTLETLEIGIRAMIYSPNDAREILGLDAVEGGDVYQNPNTSSGGTTSGDTPGGESDDDDGDDTSPEGQRPWELLGKTIRGRLRDLLQVEASRIRAAAEKGDDEAFATWCDRFYNAGNWGKTFERAWTDLGGLADDAAALINDHAVMTRTAGVAGVDEHCRHLVDVVPGRLADKLVAQLRGAS